MSIAASEDESWFDDDAGRLVRPYTVSNGRTRPTNELDMLSLVIATGRYTQGRLDVEHAQALGLCHHPTSVAEVSARLRLPIAVAKILLSDLVDCGALIARAPRPAADPTDPHVLEALLDGLRRRL